MTSNTARGLLTVAVFWGSILGIASYLYMFGVVGLVVAALVGISVLIFRAGAL